MAGVDYAERVRKMWSMFLREGIDAMRPYVDEEVEFTPSNGASTLRGWDELVAYWAAHGPIQSVVAHGIEQHGECVVVHGSLRSFRDGGFVDTQPSWVYFFCDDRLRRAVAFASREDALTAVAQHRNGG